jgi:large subunit ribosomal protein L17
MRHRKDKRKLGRNSSHRKAMLNNMVRNLLISESINTTLAKAKETKRLADKVINLTKEDTLANKRAVYNVLQDHKLTSMVFKEIGPRFKGRAGGYTRIVQLDNRPGDGAKKAILSLVEITPKSIKKDKVSKIKKKAAKPKEDAKDLKQHKEAAPAKEKAEKPADETKKSKGQEKGFMKNLRNYLKKGNKEQ